MAVGFAVALSLAFASAPGRAHGVGSVSGQLLSAPFAFARGFGFAFILRLCHHQCTRVKCCLQINMGGGTGMAGIDDTIATLETKLKQAKARKQQLDARKRTIHSKKNRADDTRRKILVGAAILAKVDRGEWPKARLLDMMNQTLTRPNERKLFGLDDGQDSVISVDSIPATSD